MVKSLNSYRLQTWPNFGARERIIVQKWRIKKCLEIWDIIIKEISWPKGQVHFIINLLMMWTNWKNLARYYIQRVWYTVWNEIVLNISHWIKNIFWTGNCIFYCCIFGPKRIDRKGKMNARCHALSWLYLLQETNLSNNRIVMMERCWNFKPFKLDPTENTNHFISHFVNCFMRLIMFYVRVSLNVF